MSDQRYVWVRARDLRAGDIVRPDPALHEWWRVQDVVISDDGVTTVVFPRGDGGVTERGWGTYELVETRETTDDAPRPHPPATVEVEYDDDGDALVYVTVWTPRVSVCVNDDRLVHKELTK